MKNSGLRITLFLVALLLVSNHIFAQNVIPLVPKDGEELTDIAVAFKVQVTTDGPYQLQVSKNSNFTGEVLTQETSVKHLYDHVYFFTREGINVPAEKFLLTPGTWYWRVSDNNGTSWSTTQSLVVNNNHSSKPQPWEITSEKPLFHWRLRSLVIENPETAAAQLKKMVPDAIKDYVVLDLGHSFLFHMTKGRDLLEYSRFFNDLGYKFTFDIGSFDHKDRVGSLAELEQVFKELPNCVGAATSELFYRYFFEELAHSQFEGALELCRKYGKMFVYSDMNHVRPKWIMYTNLNWDKFNNDNYGDYLVPLYKNTDPWGAYTCVSALQGMKLTGMVKNIGIWSDEWCWEKFGNPGEFNLENWSQNGHQGDGAQLTYPFIQHIKQYIYGITYGSTVFALEGNMQWDYQTGEPNDNHSRYLVPFVEAILSENLVPSQNALNTNFKVIVNSEDIEQEERKVLTYQDGNIWGDFLRSTYGIRNTEIYNSSIQTDRGAIRQSAYLEMTPNTDRYPTGIPFLPKPEVISPVINGSALEVIKISDLDTESEVNTNLNVHYPASANQAYARKIDKSFFVYNTIENEDVRQSYSVDINHGSIESLSGNIDLMSYVIGKCRDDGKTLFVQANGYVANPGLKGGKYTLSTYPTILKFKCTEKPVLASDEMAAIVSQNWNSNTNVFTIEVDHTTAGAVNFTLTGNVSSDSFTLGNSSSNASSSDGWKSNMVVNETDTYTNNSGSSQKIEINQFSFYARQQADPLTPFVVKVNGDNNFTILAVGSTRNNSAYSVGQNAVAFKDGTSKVITLGNGETIATGFIDANADGSGGNLGSVIPFDNGGDEIWYTGGGASSNAGSVSEGSAPGQGANTITTLTRSYKFNISFTITTTSTEQTAYPNGTPHSIPGKIEFENYDDGGEGIAYHDANTANNGGKGRTNEGVDVQTCGEGGLNIGWTSNGEWLEYTVDVATDGDYDLNIRYAAQSATGKLNISIGSSTANNISLPSTSGWQTYQTVTQPITLSAGQHIMRVDIVTSGINLNYVDITSSAPANLISNNGFEMGDLTSWAGWGTRSVVSNKYSGSYGVQVTGAASLIQVVDVDPNTTYTLSAQCKVNSGSTASLGAKEFGGTDQVIGVTNTTYTLKSLQFSTGANNTTAKIYYYVGSSGNIAFADDFELVKDNSKSAQDGVIENPTAKRKMLVYPNPNSNKLLNIVVPKYEGSMQLRIFDVRGKLVFSGQFSNDQKIQINLSELNLNKGIYLIKTICEDIAYNQSLLIN